MSDLSHVVVWVRRCLIWLVFPLIIIMWGLSWVKLSAGWTPLFYESLSPISIEHDILELPRFGKCLYFALETIPVLLMLAALVLFLRILKLCKRGLCFSKEVIRLLKCINLLALGWAVYHLFSDTFASLLISLFRPAGKRYLRILLEIDDVMRFFAVLILFMLLYLVQEAYKIKSEQDLVV